ncbi:MAG: prenyltransferase [Spirochaetia bacterium]
MELVTARFSDVLNVVEIRTKIISVSSFALGTAYAAYEAEAFSIGMTLLMLAAVLLVDMGTTGFNSYFDAKRGVDNRRYNREKSKVLVHNGLSAGFALLVSLACFALAAVFGLVIIILVGPEVLLVGVASMAVGYLYNGGPLPISTTPVGELFAGGFLGGVLFVLSYYVQTATLSAAVLWASLPSLLLVSSILAVNNTCDRLGDKYAGRRTIAVVFGRRASEYLGYALGLVAHLLVLWYAIGEAAAAGGGQGGAGSGGFGAAAADFAGAGSFPQAAFVAGVVSLAFALWEYRRMHRRGYSHETKGPSMQSVSSVFLVFSAAVFASFMWGIVAG